MVQLTLNELIRKTTQYQLKLNNKTKTSFIMEREINF